MVGNSKYGPGWLYISGNKINRAYRCKGYCDTIYEIHTDIKLSVQLDENGIFTGVNGEYRVKNIIISSKPLDLQKTYTVVSYNYIIKNDVDGMNMFQNYKLVLEDIMIYNQAMLIYITKELRVW